MSLLQIIIIQVVAFIIIIAFLRLIFYQQLSSGLKRMQELQNRNLEKEISLNKEVERAVQHRQQEVVKGKEEADKLRAQAREEAQKIKEQVLAQAKQETDTLLKEAHQEGERLKRDTVLKVEQTSVNLAVGIIREIFSGKTRQALEKELIDELIESLDTVDKEKIKSDIKKAEITSASAILESQKNTIREKLQRAIGHPIELEEKVDASIISGLVINLGGLVLDGSLSNKIRKIIPYLREAGGKNAHK